MSQVTTHVLDAAAGAPAVGVAVTLSGPGGVIATGTTDADGRIRELGPDALEAGDYRLEFDTGAYFAASGTAAFYPRVVIDVTLAAGAHSHVPLLLSPFAYSTYRGT